MSDGRNFSDDYQLGRAGHEINSLAGLAGLEARKAAEAEQKLTQQMMAPRRDRGAPVDPIRNVIGLTALAVAGYVWWEATRRGSDSALMTAVIAFFVSLAVFSLPFFRPIFHVLVGVLKVAAWIGMLALGYSYGKRIGLL